jgi:hypothetical protein
MRDEHSGGDRRMLPLCLFDDNYEQDTNDVGNTNCKDTLEESPLSLFIVFFVVKSILNYSRKLVL